MKIMSKHLNEWSLTFFQLLFQARKYYACTAIPEQFITSAVYFPNVNSKYPPCIIHELAVLAIMFHHVL